MAPSKHIPGNLSLYPIPKAPNDFGWEGEERPYFTSGDQTAERAVVFIGGLFNGLLNVPYVFPLAGALEKAKWRL